MNNTNLATGGEPIHQIIEPYQTTNKKTWEKKQNKNKTKKQTTNVFKLFWPPHEGIISTNKNTWETNIAKKKHTIKHTCSNYSGHHMKGSYQKEQTHGKTTTTKITCSN